MEIFLIFIGLGIFLAFVFIILILIGLYTVDQAHRGLIQRFGKYKKYVEPGLHFKIPLIDKVIKRDIREDTVEIRPQPVITKDNVEILVDGVFWCRVQPNETSVKKSFYEIDNYIYALKKLTHTNLREEYGKMDFDEALTSREQVGQSLIKILHEKAKHWGIDVTAVEIQTIDPPADIKKAMHKEKTAEQERRARRKRALGEKEAAEQEKEAEILRAEGEAQGTMLKAEAEAKSIKQVSEAAEAYFKERAEARKKLDVIQKTFKDSSKIILPTNAPLLNLLGLDKEDKKKEEFQ
ncbi:MAG: SPFH/Band 7/PHB domain protein [Promethearchaeota archaeon]|nr:MAG: SPFH/Band 7/PHB domain protein [Candidatus Lokiarchaeota archaeon]